MIFDHFSLQRQSVLRELCWKADRLDGRRVSLKPVWALVAVVLLVWVLL